MTDEIEPFSDSETKILHDDNAHRWALWNAFDTDDLKEAEARLEETLAKQACGAGADK